MLDIIQEEEAEWCGLTRSEAIEKQRRIEAKENPIRPLQDVYTEELVNKLKGKQCIKNKKGNFSPSCLNLSIQFHLLFLNRKVA